MTTKIEQHQNKNYNSERMAYVQDTCPTSRAKERFHEKYKVAIFTSERSERSYLGTLTFFDRPTGAIRGRSPGAGVSWSKLESFAQEYYPDTAGL